jgi:hypothetical protein
MFKIQRSLQGLLLIAIVTLFSVLLLTPVRAATIYYVATNGSDSNPGTQNLPFATLSKAIEKVAAGDTVNVRGGIYYLKQGSVDRERKDWHRVGTHCFSVISWGKSDHRWQ